MKVKVGGKAAPVKKVAPKATVKKVAPKATVKKNAVIRGTVKKGGTVKVAPPPRTTGTVKRKAAPVAKKPAFSLFSKGNAAPAPPARKPAVPARRSGAPAAKADADPVSKRQQLAALGAVSFSVVAAGLKNANNKPPPAKKSPAPAAAAKGKPAPARPARPVSAGADLPTSGPRPILPGADIGYKKAAKAAPRISNMQVKELPVVTKTAKEASEKPVASTKTQKPQQAARSRSNNGNDNLLIGLGGLGVYFLLNQPSPAEKKAAAEAAAEAAPVEAVAPITEVAAKAEEVPVSEPEPAAPAEPVQERKSAKEWLYSYLNSRNASPASKPSGDRPEAQEWISAWKSSMGDGESGDSSAKKAAADRATELQAEAVKNAAVVDARKAAAAPVQPVYSQVPVQVSNTENVAAEDQPKRKGFFRRLFSRGN